MKKSLGLAGLVAMLPVLLAGCGEFMIDAPISAYGGSYGSGSRWSDRDSRDSRVEVEHRTAIDVTVSSSRAVPPLIRVPVAAAPAPASADKGLNPVIQSFTANPGNEVPAGQPITFQVVAHDPKNQPLQFNWSSTGGTMTATSGQVTTWLPPDAPGLYTVSTIISNGRGGSVVGHQNLRVRADGSVATAAVAPAAPVVTPVAPAVTPVAPAVAPVVPAVEPAPTQVSAAQ